MKRNRTAVAVCGVALALVTLVAAGCSKKISDVILPNEKPVVRLTHAPVDQGDTTFYAFRMNWVGYDPDGRVDHFLYAIDPPNVAQVDSTWQSTTRNEQIVFFKASVYGNRKNEVGLPLAFDGHVFAIRAVDDRGEMSDPVYRAFFAKNVAPVVQILSPRPNPAFEPIVPPTVRIRWRGTDYDGQFTTKPLKYKFRLFGISNPDFPQISNFIQFAAGRPDSFRNLYAPGFGPSEHCPTCSPWDSTSAETTEFQYTHLEPGNTYLFVVTGFDEAGAFDPIFLVGTNMLKVVVAYGGSYGPILSMYNDFFFYRYRIGGNGAEVPIEVPADQPLRINWFAEATPGTDVKGYRWVLDLQDLDDETQRTNEDTDYYHWSAWSATTFSATLPKELFTRNGEIHHFYIEAEDNAGLRSRGTIQYRIVRATFEKNMLFVKDTRLSPDQRIPGDGIDAPRGQWPSTAELDTFFFARGGVPWKDYPGYGSDNPTLSQPGIFRGYEFDTLGTRGLPGGIVPLSILGLYKHVVWYTDAVGATYTRPSYDPLAPMTSIRVISTPGNPSTISTFMKQGGTVWFLGGGVALGSLLPWNKGDSWRFMSTPPENDLGPSRMMYDFPHWQSELHTLPVGSARPNSPMGRGWPGQPNYDRLLNNNLEPRIPETDPLPPLRNPERYYLDSFEGEFLSTQPNNIREDADQDPSTSGEESELDTLYNAYGASANRNPIMTYYHGFVNPDTLVPGAPGQPPRAHVIFSGFPLWYFQRSQIIPVADFVLHDVWGLPLPPAGSRDLHPINYRAARASAPLRTAQPIGRPARAPFVAPPRLARPLGLAARAPRWQ